MARAVRTALEADKAASGSVILSHQIHQSISFSQLRVKLTSVSDKLEIQACG